ncbi:LOW QUALITY PROTEIN: cytochrome P450 4F2-like [Amphiura filiformis]|uniref:LOW QUALITY PROTEIN: cytochrome P450 4F2-like n=1 Tax=Amphiura filiformis TaxID=82378 RepID=UPI003B221A7F
MIRMTARLKGPFQFWIGPFSGALAVVDPDSMKTVLSTSEPKDEFLYGAVRPWIGDGLLLSKGKKWARNRRLLTPAFHFKILKSYMDIFKDSTNQLIDKFRAICDGQEKSIEIFEHVSLLTLDSLLKCIFSIESNCQLSAGNIRHPYLKGVLELSHTSVKRINFLPYHIAPIFYLSPTGFRWRQACRDVHNYSRDVIHKRKLMIQRGDKDATDKKYVDFLDILLRAKDDTGEGLTEKEIQEEVDTFMFEGHDTTASGISWILYNLAKHPEYQQKCQQEIDAMMESKETKDIEWDDLNKLPYLTMCIKESLRFTSPVPIVSRITTRDVVFADGRSVPAGTRVQICIRWMHLNPHVWKDPETFDPERFAPENINDISPFAFVPFSAGPRNCIGQNFAMNEMKIVTAMILRNLSFSVEPDFTAVSINSLVLRSENGIHLKVKPRHKS